MLQPLDVQHGVWRMGAEGEITSYASEIKLYSPFGLIYHLLCGIFFLYFFRLYTEETFLCAMLPIKCH